MSRAAWKQLWKALFLKEQYRKYARFEKKVFSQCDRLITVSEEDAVLARDAFRAGEVQVVDNGVDIEFFHPGEQERDPRNLLFLGSLDWHPNIDAVQLLVSRLFPEIRRECPGATLTVVGRHPSEAMRKMLREAPNVTLVADAPDVRPYLWRCGMMVVPLRSGGGSRLKILEALATECPVVSTRIGAEGLRLESDKHLIITDSDRDFASRTISAMSSPEEMAAMTAQGRRRVVEEYHWDVLADRLEAVWENTVSKIAKPTPPPMEVNLTS
jgi:glycosyltransferase involved in cell wall biosynthesis